MKRIFVVASMVLAVLLPCWAKEKNVLDIKESLTDDAIVFPEAFETDAQKMLESWYIKNYTSTDDRYKTRRDPRPSDETVKKRLAALPTVVEMPFNQVVRSYIDRYVDKGRGQVAAILGLGLYYMPIFEQALEAEQLPLELKYLPVIESALDPNAVSRHGAAGLWQFMPATAKGLGMEVNSLVDERRDPYLSSKKAASYLHDLYDTYGDWSLAIAAYNCGPGAVNKAIRRAGGDPKSHDFWSIYNYLTPETRGYVPMFIAANYVMNYYPEHDISPVLSTKPLVTDTIGITRRLHLDQVGAVLDIPKEELRILNPQFRADVIPGSPEKAYMLILPSRQVQAFIMSEGDIYAYEADKYNPREEAEPQDVADASTEGESGEDDLLTANKPASAGDEQPAVGPAAGKPDFSAKLHTVTHTVAAGETLADIAAKYETTVADIRNINSLRRNAVRTGQKLRVQTPLAEVAQTPSAPAQKVAATPSTKASGASQTKKKTQTQAKPQNHQIKQGESLSSISKKYGVTVEQLKKANGMTSDNIRAGQTLSIPAKGSSANTSKSTGTKKKGTTKRSKSKRKR